MATEGHKAERLVVERLRAVLPPEVELLHNVHWLTRDHGHVGVRVSRARTPS